MKRALALVLALAGPALHAAAFDVQSLMALLRAAHPERATFHETKDIALLDRPVETDGELRFTPPDRLEKRSRGLNAEALIADRDGVTIERAGRKQVLPLTQYPEVGVFVDSIRGTLAGDQALLEKTYELALTGAAARWTLTLRPREARLARVVKRIDIEGAQGRVQRVEIQQADGDRSVMTITPASP